MCMFYFLFSLLLSSSMVAMEAPTQNDPDDTKNNARALVIQAIVNSDKVSGGIQPFLRKKTPVPSQAIPIPAKQQLAKTPHNSDENALKPSSGSPLRKSPSVSNLPALDRVGVTLTQLITSKAPRQPNSSSSTTYNPAQNSTYEHDKDSRFKQIVGFQVKKT